MNKINYNLIVENTITGNKNIICTSHNKDTLLCEQQIANVLLDLKCEDAKKCADCLASRNKCYYTKKDAESALNNINCYCNLNIKDLEVSYNTDNEWYINCPKYLDLISLQSIKYSIN